VKNRKAKKNVPILFVRKKEGQNDLSKGKGLSVESIIL
jgi:hypothetical protein